MSLDRVRSTMYGPEIRVAVTIVMVSLTVAGLLTPAAAEPLDPEIGVVTDTAGSRLQVDSQDFMVFGMNWGYIPIGENYLFNLWSQPDEVIEAALAREMPLLKDMGVNAIRQNVGIPPRWVQYIYERYGIFTIINHTVGRYGYTLDGVWLPSVDYSDPRFRTAVKQEIGALVDEYRDVPGILMWLLGNENNYGLHWTSFEIEALPEGERDEARARYLYSLYEEITLLIKERDPNRLVAISNGDVQYVDIIAEECRSLDVLGTNVYRGISARDIFQVVKDNLGIPVMFTEFGADAWNAKEMREDQIMQARYLLGQWQEIYEQSSGKGRVGNAIGGCIFQWSDGWWKFGQESRLDIHDTNASWPNGGYIEDYVEGENNMNEEWWGICAKGPPDHRGLYEIYPRAAYYGLRRAFRLDPYDAETDLEAIRDHFDAIQPAAAELEARGDHASLLANSMSRVHLSGLRLEFETYNTGGYLTTTPKQRLPGAGQPAFRGFDRMESFYAEFKAQPTQNVTGTFTVNVLGHVPENRINEIFYENRGRPRTSLDAYGDTLGLEDIERVKVYQASVSWDDRWFTLDGFYRTGHFHWGYEGDFFGLYREAFYGENIDIYNAEAPVGFEIAGKKQLEGLKVAFGPELWWGANPAVILKYQRRLGPFDATGIFQEDIAEQFSVTSTTALPLPSTRKATLALATNWGPATIEVGGIWSGSTKVGDKFEIAEETDTGYVVLQDEVLESDAFGAKAKITVEKGRWHWYVQGASMGLVADGGPTATTTFTGWNLKDSGSGNQTNILTGLAVNMGDFQVGPNFLWQKPIVGPIPLEVVPDFRLRNVNVGPYPDPFAVRANRETVAGELILTYDPTPATWMWAWDNDVREDARLAASLGYVFRHLPTTQDAATGIGEDGKSRFAFTGSTPPRDLWEISARVVSRLGTGARLVAHFYVGTGEPKGDDQRLIDRYGGDGRITWGPAAFEMFAKINDWGPYDYHRDFNLTFPAQLMADLSYSLGAPRWFGLEQTRIGVRGLWRSLDEYSPRYLPAEDGVLIGSEQDGDEYEIQTYLHLAL